MLFNLSTVRLSRHGLQELESWRSKPGSCGKQLLQPMLKQPLQLSMSTMKHAVWALECWTCMGCTPARLLQPWTAGEGVHPLEVHHPPHPPAPVTIMLDQLQISAFCLDCAPGSSCIRSSELGRLYRSGQQLVESTYSRMSSVYGV